MYQKKKKKYFTKIYICFCDFVTDFRSKKANGILFEALEHLYSLQIPTKSTISTLLEQTLVSNLVLFNICLHLRHKLIENFARKSTYDKSFSTLLSTLDSHIFSERLWRTNQQLYCPYKSNFKRD